jgi:hypothetical protein
MEALQMWNVIPSSTIAVVRMLPLIALVLVAGCTDQKKSFASPTSLASDLDSHSSGNVTLPNPAVTADVTTICESVTISWNNVAVSGHSATRWHIQLDDEPTFADPVLYNDAQYATTSYGPIALVPGTYWFRVKAMSTEARVRNSDFVVISFTVVACPTGCTFTQGYWKNHDADWPVSSLTLGTVSYTQSQLLSIFDAPVAGNGLISLAHQLIAAKMNIANGASGSAINSTIAAADALIGSLVVPPVGSDHLETSATSALVTALDDYNKGVTGPGHCESQ